MSFRSTDMIPFIHVPPWLSSGNPESPGIPFAQTIQPLHGCQQGPNRGGKITVDAIRSTSCRPFSP
jgi:hypothetical protein